MRVVGYSVGSEEMGGKNNMEKALRFLKGKKPKHFKDEKYAKLEIAEWLVEYNQEQLLNDSLNKAVVKNQSDLEWQEKEARDFWKKVLEIKINKSESVNSAWLGNFATEMTQEYIKTFFGDVLRIGKYKNPDNNDND